MSIRAIVLTAACFLSIPAFAADWVKLINGKDLSGWKVIGDGVWTVMRDGTLVGQRHLQGKNQNQSWIYTKKNYEAFDLHLEYWLRLDGNSGISLRDSSRARYSITAEWDAVKTPAHIGYEIQLISGEGQKYPSGSVYLFQAAKDGVQRESDWNTMDIESRKDAIRVKINGQLVSQSAGDAARPVSGPIGFQLHDKNTVVMFRDVRIQER